MPPKVLIAAPTAEYKDYCLPEWSKYLQGLTYPNKEILIVDNSKNPEYHKKIIASGLPCIYHRPKELNHLRSIMVSCQNLIRDKVLNEDFDYLFFNESDQFAPANVIEHLMLQRKAVIGLPYFIHNCFDSKLICFKEEKFGYIRMQKPIFNDEGFFWFDGTIKPAYQIGFGAILIHKSVLKKIKFRVDLEDQECMDSDSYFHNDCKKLGIPVFVDANYMTYHWNSNWFKISKQEAK